jgi:hypothetical protein
MTKYRVRLFVIRSHYFTVEAENEEAAVEFARNRWGETGEGDYVDTYSDRIHDHDVEEMD